MSFQASRWAWMKSAPLSATQKLILLALADYANEAHTCWPTLATIAAKTRLSRRTVINALARLVDLNLVTRVPRGPHRTFLYILAVGEEATVPEKVHGAPFEGPTQPLQEALGTSSKVQRVHPYGLNIDFQGASETPFKVHDVHLGMPTINFHHASETPFKVHQVHLEVHEMPGGGAGDAPLRVHEVHPNLSYEPIKEPLTELSAASSPSETEVTVSTEDDTPTGLSAEDNGSWPDNPSPEIPQGASPSETPPDDFSPETSPDDLSSETPPDNPSPEIPQGASPSETPSDDPSPETSPDDLSPETPPDAPSPETPRQTFQRWIGLFEQTGFSRKSLGTPTVLAGLRQWIGHGVTDDDIHDALFIAQARLNGALPGSPAYLLKIMPGLLQEKQQAGPLLTLAGEDTQPRPRQPFRPTLRERYLHESYHRPTPLSSAERMRQAGLEYLRQRGDLEPEISDVFE